MSETPKAKSLSDAPFNVMKFKAGIITGPVDMDPTKLEVKPDALEIADQFSTSYEAYVYLRDALNMRGRVFDSAGKDVTEDVIPKHRIKPTQPPQADATSIE